MWGLSPGRSSIRGQQPPAPTAVPSQHIPRVDPTHPAETGKTLDRKLFHDS